MKQILSIFLLLSFFVGDAHASDSDVLRAQLESLTIRRLAIDVSLNLRGKGFREEEISAVLNGPGFHRFSQAVLDQPKLKASIDRFVAILNNPESRNFLLQRNSDSIAVQQAQFLLTLQQKLREKQLDREGWQTTRKEGSAGQLWKRIRAFLLE